MGDMRKVVVAAEGASQFLQMESVDAEDLEELFTLSDRIAVIYEGRIMAVLPVAEATAQRVGLLMAGYQEEDAA